MDFSLRINAKYGLKESKTRQVFVIKIKNINAKLGRNLIHRYASPISELILHFCKKASSLCVFPVPS
jgi:hypothetical protein